MKKLLINQLNNNNMSFKQLDDILWGLRLSNKNMVIKYKTKEFKKYERYT